MLINGKEIAKKVTEEALGIVSEAKSCGIFPKIALINASDDPASEIYVNKKKELAESIGIISEIYKFDDFVKENDIANLIEKLNADDSVHAILLQSPLANNLNFRKLIDLIDPSKDVDGLTTVNQGFLFIGEPSIVPCTPMGIMHLIRSVCDKLDGLHAVVLGRSTIVGKPVAQLLLHANCSVTTLHSRSMNMKEICKTADIIVSAVGKPHFINADFIKSGAIVIDVGINRIINENGTKKIVGDVKYNDVFDIAKAITPVPNGVGPMTVAYLMHNTAVMAKKL